MRYDVVGIGSALLDFTVKIDDSMLNKAELKKGQMHLIDCKKSKEILSLLGEDNVKITAGGSAANTLAGVVCLGGNAALIGKIGNDEHGKIYEQKTKENGVETGLCKNENIMTGHAITFITPDSERTFATHLGAALSFNKNDIDEQKLKECKILHIEGYQLEDPFLKEASISAIKLAKMNGAKISIDLSDSALVLRNLEEFKRIVKEYADIVFANENEAEAFTGKKEEEALNIISEMCETAIVKLGGKGSLIKSNGVVYKIPINEVKVVNTNGAGDAYAAGILYSIANDIDMARAGRIAAYISSQVVASEGARLERSLKEDLKRV